MNVIDSILYRCECMQRYSCDGCDYQYICSSTNSETKPKEMNYYEIIKKFGEIYDNNEGNV